MSADISQNIVNVSHSTDLSILGLISSADLISKIVMLMLLIASIWSWAIIFNKIYQIKKIKVKIKNFETLFWSGQSIDQLYENIKRTNDNPLANIFVNAMAECKKQNFKGAELENSILKIGQKERVLQTMNLVRNREIEALESNLTFLATTGSATPFIGLFGTVWGIMTSFQSIAVSKNTTLAVVAPGIAEALLATAIGLFAAIPAVIFYNYLASQVNFYAAKIDDFIAELNNILSRAIDEEKI